MVLDSSNKIIYVEMHSHVVYTIKAQEFSA